MRKLVKKNIENSISTKKSKKTNRTNSNFEQRKYTKKDFKDLEDRLLGRGDYTNQNSDPECDEKN